MAVGCVGELNTIVEGEKISRIWSVFDQLSESLRVPNARLILARITTPVLFKCVSELESNNIQSLKSYRTVSVEDSRKVSIVDILADDGCHP